MSDEGKDVKAAEAEFLEIFTKVDSSSKKEMDKAFLKSFLTNYHRYKRSFNIVEGHYSPYEKKNKRLPREYYNHNERYTVRK